MSSSYPALYNNLHDGWAQSIPELVEKYDIQKHLAEKAYLPPVTKVFHAFTFFPIHELKVVILGLDPYIHKGQADGLAFSIPASYSGKCPPSLRNVFKEIERSYGSARSSTDLSDLARQGVLLLNTALTVEPHQSAAHLRIWRGFTRDLLSYINENTNHVVFMMWGLHAQSFTHVINESQHLVLRHTHPSPLSRKPFVGNDHFVLCNKYLVKHGRTPIQWI